MSGGGSAPSLVKPTDGVVSRLINRRVSTRISTWLARRRRPPSPDAVSLVAAWLVAAAGPLFAAGHPVAAGIAAEAGSILDGVDGEIARLTGRASRAGALLDTVLDRLADIAALAGAALAAAQALTPLQAAILAALGVSGDLLVTYLHAVGEKLAGRHPALVGRIPNIAGRDTRLFILFLAGLFSAPAAGLAAIAALGYTYTLAKTIELLNDLQRREQQPG
jgi:CDP-L-myo-inositol myo-inositolphosphotransferase